VEECGHCAHLRLAYNSCRNRHCPKCQNKERAKWLQDRRAELLPVEYFHVVFTLPEQIAAIAFQNKKAVYGILCRAASEALLTIARDPKHLGADIGFFAILHTWGQNLLHHPHVHCVIPGGGLGPEPDRWISCRPGFFLSVRVLSRLFRRLFLEALEKAFQKRELEFFGELEPLQKPDEFASYLMPVKDQDWVVYAKPPFGGPAQVLEYLGRYTLRVALSNVEGLSFPEKQKSHKMTVTAEEIIRRFLLHLVPDGFQRIRHSGFLSNRRRKSKLAPCRQLPSNPATELLPQAAPWAQAAQSLSVPATRPSPPNAFPAPQSSRKERPRISFQGPLLPFLFTSSRQAARFKPHSHESGV